MSSLVLNAFACLPDVASYRFIFAHLLPKCLTASRCHGNLVCPVDKLRIERPCTGSELRGVFVATVATHHPGGQPCDTYVQNECNGAKVRVLYMAVARICTGVVLLSKM